MSGHGSSLAIKILSIHFRRYLVSFVKSITGANGHMSRSDEVTVADKRLKLASHITAYHDVQHRYMPVVSRLRATVSSDTHSCTLAQNTSSGKFGGRRRMTVLSFAEFAPLEGGLDLGGLGGFVLDSEETIGYCV